MKHIFMGKNEIAFYRADLDELTNPFFKMYTPPSYRKEYYLYPYIIIDNWKQLEINQQIEFPLIVGDIYKFNKRECKVEKTVINPDGSITCFINYSISLVDDEGSKEKALQAIEDALSKFNKPILESSPQESKPKKSLWSRFVDWILER